jgi:hypothetical protein
MSKRFNPQMIVRIYLEEKTIKKTAEKLKCSVGTISRYLKLASFDVRLYQNKSKGREISPNHHGALVKWIRENKKQPLPLKVKDIMTLTGCTKNEVKCYFYRIKKKLLKRLEEYLLKKPDIFLTDIEKRRFPLKAVESFRIEIGKDFHFNLYLTLYTKQNKKIILSLNDVERMVKKG